MDHDLHLRGPVVSLVPLRTGHAEALAGLGDPDAYAWHTSPPPLTPDEARRSIEDLVANPTCTAFEAWSCERVALRCDAGNVRSARAIQRLGARPEGVLRAHRRRHDGTVADTAYFSIVRAEWPDVRRGLLARVEPDA